MCCVVCKKNMTTYRQIQRVLRLLLLDAIGLLVDDTSYCFTNSYPSYARCKSAEGFGSRMIDRSFLIPEDDPNRETVTRITA